MNRLRVASLLLLMLCSAQLVPAQAHGQATMCLPLMQANPPSAHQALHARITAGVLPHGARIVVRTEHGEILGTISPFGIPPGHEAGTYEINIPPEAVHDRHICLRLTLEAPGEAPRTLTRNDIRAVRLVNVPVTPF